MYFIRNETYPEASGEFSVPRTVIFNHIKGRKTPINELKWRLTVLSLEVENIEKCLMARA